MADRTASFFEGDGQKEPFDQIMRRQLGGDPKAMAPLAFRMRPYGLTSLFEVYRALRAYTLAGVAEKIRCPILICDPEQEAFWPGQSQQLYDALTDPKTLVRFTAAEGADPALRAEGARPARPAHLRLVGRDPESDRRALNARTGSSARSGERERL